ncbi:MAG: outer membrane protein assembly factor BamA [Pseudomonadota bacterium]
MTRKALRAWVALGYAAFTLASGMAVAVSDSKANSSEFVVEDIRVEGLERMDVGTVLSYLPVKKGDKMSSARSSESLKALFSTGFFKDVRIEADGGILIISVIERPTIDRVTLHGNKEIDSDTLKKFLKQVGINESEILDRAALDKAEQEIKRQYLNRSRYNAEVKTTLTPLERNRVAVDIDIVEDEPALIQKIDIVGNDSFPQDKLLKLFSIRTKNWLSWWTKDDQFSQTKLNADLEALKNFYLNEGYLEFEVVSNQASISTDKKSIFVTVRIKEGKPYTVKSVELLGNTIVKPEELQPLIKLKAGERFSREKLTASVQAITDRLGNDGYAFAAVNPVPELNREAGEVSFKLVVDPNRRVYVRQINISGNRTTRDEVVRREIRQMEASPYNLAQVTRSQQRIERLGFFQDTTVEPAPVPGTSDQVDMNVNVTERPTGSITFGAGFASGEGLILNAGISQENVLGTGNSLSTQINTSKVNRVLSLSFTDPYWTVDGVSRGFDIYHRVFTSNNLSNVAHYDTSTTGAGVRFGFPATETQRYNLGFNAEHVKTTLYDDSPLNYYEFFNACNGQTCRYANSTATPPVSSTLKPGDYSAATLSTSLGWSIDTRDNIVFPNGGYLHSIQNELAYGQRNDALSNDRQNFNFYRLTTQHQWFKKLGDTPAVLMLNGELGYATKDTPFYKNFFAGGPGSVRGYEQGTLGKQAEINTSGQKQALGAKKKLIVNAELFFPIPGLSQDISKSVRASVFFDAGAIRDSLRHAYTEEEKLKYSTGLAISWFSPLGPLKFSFAKPIKATEEDKKQSFQFQLGRTF